MNTLLLSVIIGLVAGIIDIIPMIIQKIPAYSTVSAFVHHFFVSIVILNIDIPHIPWWIEGGCIGLALALPMVIQVGHSDKKSWPVIASASFILGEAVGIAGHFLK